MHLSEPPSLADRRRHGRYALSRLVRADAGSEIWHATPVGGTDPILLQFPTAEVPDAQVLARYYREFEILRGLEGRFAMMPAALETDGVAPHLIFPAAAEAVALDVVLAGQPMPLERALPLVAEIAEALSKLHQSGVIHNSIRAANVLLRDGDEPALVGFGRATRMPDARGADAQELRGQEVALAHLAPEQTGRINRVTDYRADLYGLGVLIFRVLTGRYPLEAEGVMGWVHAHVASAPSRLRDLDPKFPAELDALVDCLLAKNPEDRYQNAFGVARDLRALAAGESVDVESGRQGLSGRFALAQALYGRESEAATLRAVFDEVCLGARRAVVVRGRSGIGKTALVEEIHRPLVERRGRFAGGKFGQFGRATPYSAIREALSRLVQELSVESERWLDELDELGSALPVIADFLPPLSALLGPQPPLPRLPASDAEERFLAAMADFFAHLCRDGEPLVLFVDDLQWADQASLALLESLLGAERVAHLMVILSYRDNEVTGGHPVLAMERRLADAGVELPRLGLEPLSHRDVRSLLADSFQRDDEATAALARIVSEKAGGNPFHTRQLLRSLHNAGAIVFDFLAGSWSWDSGAVQAAAVTSNVVELMVARVRELGPRIAEVLSFASCIGPRFRLDELSAAMDVPPSALHETLMAAVSASLLVPLEGSELWMEMGEEGGGLVDAHADRIGYRFAHDRVQQAAYSLNASDALPRIHLTLARFLRTRGHTDGELYSTTNHYNEALDLVVDPEERKGVAELNLRAARQAAAGGAHDAAHEYAGRATSLITEIGRRTDPRLSVQCLSAFGESKFVLGEVDGALGLYGEALELCETTLERIPISTRVMETHISQGRVSAALETLVGMLDEFGIHADPEEAERLARGAADAVREARRGRTVEEIVNGPELVDPEKAALVGMLGRSIDTAFMNGRDWVVTVTSIAVRTALESGVSPPSSICFATYGLMDAEPETAEGFATRFEFGRIGALVAERFGELQWISAANVSNPHQFQVSFSVAVSRFERASVAGWESGALTWAGYADVRRLHMMFAAGVDLRKLDEERRERQTRLACVNQAVSDVCCEVTGALAISLQSLVTQPRWLGGSWEAEQALEKRSQMMGPWAACKFYSAQQILASFWRDYPRVVEASRKMAGVIHAMHAMSHEHLFYLFEALALANAPEAWELTEAARDARLDEIGSFFHEHAKLNDDYRPCELLVAAARARSLGETADAFEGFARAADAASESGQEHLRALAYEEAGFHARELGRMEFSDFCLGRAHSTYLGWGAAAKAYEISERFPAAVGERRSSSGVRALVAESQPVSLDLQTVLDASRAIFEELTLERVLARVVASAVQNAGATRGVLILGDSSELRVEACATVDRVVVASSPLEDYAGLPRSVIEYVARTGEPVIVDDARVCPRFMDDPDIVERELRSMFVLPVHRQGRLVAILHLENELTTAAFTSDRVALLRTIAAQAAVSLHNARLYDELSRLNSELEERVAERTAALSTANEQLASEIEERRRAQRELVALQDGMVEMAREAGMSEVASGVLHNVGNLLNTLTVSHSLLDEGLRDSRVEQVQRIAALLQEQGDGFAEFLAEDAKGQRVPEFLDALGGALVRERAVWRRELAESQRVVERLGQFVQETQLPVGVTAVESPVLVADLVDAVLSSVPDEVEVVREVADGPPVLVDRNRTTGILRQLLSNALDAVAQSAAPRVVLRVERTPGGVVFTLGDNGGGIEPGELTAIFSRGHSSKEGRSGAGLHEAANAATQLGGKLGARSDGVGRGATFVLELPCEERPFSL